MNLRAHLAAALALAAPPALLAACEKPNPLYCANPAHAAEDGCRSDGGAPPDAPSCKASPGSCAGATPVCDVVSDTCVQCTADDATACAGTTPVCGSAHTCEKCTAHAQCAASQACLPDGSCADAGQVSYVDGASGLDSNPCTLDKPCKTLGEAVKKPAVIIKLSGPVHDGNQTTIDAKSFTILAAPGTTLDRDMNGPILEIKGQGARVVIYDLEITGGTGGDGHGILLTPMGPSPEVELHRVKITNNQGDGVRQNGGTLRVLERSELSRNAGLGVYATAGTLAIDASTLALNRGGGLSAFSVEFTITNNFIVRNGDRNSSTIGGAYLTAASQASGAFEYNTVVDNDVRNLSTNAGGVTCSGGFRAAHNIIAGNFHAGGTTETVTAPTNISGNCVRGDTYVGADRTALRFVDPDGLMPPDNKFDYHLTSASAAALDQVDASTTSDNTHDWDGDARPRGGKLDLGADEL